MRTITGVLSLAVPVKDGVVSLLGVAIEPSETFGAGVSTRKWIAPLVPGPSPNSLSCSATAVYSPSESGVERGSELQGPPVPAACTSATCVGPAKTRTVTVECSLALPLNEGVLSSEGEGTPFSVTSGAAL